MRLARSTSPWRVNSGTRPISRRYMRTGSSYFMLLRWALRWAAVRRFCFSVSLRRLRFASASVS